MWYWPLCPKHDCLSPPTSNTGMINSSIFYKLIYDQITMTDRWFSLTMVYHYCIGNSVVNSKYICYNHAIWYNELRLLFAYTTSLFLTLHHSCSELSSFSVSEENSNTKTLQPKYIMEGSMAVVIRSSCYNMKCILCPRPPMYYI